MHAFIKRVYLQLFQMAQLQPIETSSNRFIHNLHQNSSSSIPSPKIKNITQELIDPPDTTQISSLFPQKVTPAFSDTNFQQKQFIRSRVPQKYGEKPVAYKGESKVEWIPYQKKIIEFKDEYRKEKKPVVKKIQDFRQEIRHEEVARESIGIDYYAVQKIKKYVAREKIEKQYVTVQKMVPYKKTVYIPKTRQVYHGPNPQTYLPIYDDGQRYCSNRQSQVSPPIHLSPPQNSFYPHFSRSPPFFQSPANSYYSNYQSPHKYFSPPTRAPESIPLRVHSPNISRNYSSGGLMARNQVNGQQKFLKQNQFFSNDSYESYVPSFKY